jgi:chromosomal replication initiation ATPase DnaA
MSLIQSLHEQRKARLQRIAARAVAQPQSRSKAPARLILDRRAPAGGRQDNAYERAWALEMLGVAEPLERSRRKLKVDDILHAVARHFHVSRNDLLSTRRGGKVTLPRHVAMYLARELTTKSYPDIGRRVGKDHTTVLHAVNRIESRLTHDGELADSIRRIRQTLHDWEGSP